ncbi:DNA polymerase III subunit psi [Thorsellia kenyensis]|uniref:DNA polymerase III subunit psi n=1 Tax=Thorsellia kenyensis TaxID=1549888 RepID=A0ABV6CE32_9GAMM
MPALLRYQQSLKTLGIQTWSMKRPNVFLGEVAIALENSIQLIFLSEEIMDMNTPFLNDILTSLNLTHANLAYFPINKLSHLILPIQESKQHRLVVLFNDQQNEAVEDDIEELMLKGEISSYINELKQLKQCHLIETNTLKTLYASTMAKRNLWRQLTKYANNKTI